MGTQDDVTPYNLYAKKNLALIYFTGAFGADVSAVFDRCLADLKKLEYGLVVMSMKSVPTIDEAAIRPFRKFLHAVRHKPAELKLCDLREGVVAVLNDHSLVRPEEMSGHLTEVVGAAILRDLLK
jgi:anti-anti-sigma regulatory factor